MQQGCWEKFLFFLKHSYRDLWRHKCNSCLALCSVFIVVLSTLVVNTVVDQGPIIFVNLAQQESGEMDVWFTGSIRCYGSAICPQEMNTYPVANNMNSGYMNYTQLVELYGYKYNLAPRTHLTFFPDSAPVVDTHGYAQISGGGLYYLDLKRESDINLGTSW